MRFVQKYIFLNLNAELKKRNFVNSPLEGVDVERAIDVILLFQVSIWRDGGPESDEAVQCERATVLRRHKGASSTSHY
jgi:hypothetical protein